MPDAPPAVLFASVESDRIELTQIDSSPLCPSSPQLQQAQQQQQAQPTNGGTPGTPTKSCLARGDFVTTVRGSARKRVVFVDE